MRLMIGLAAAGLALTCQAQAAPWCPEGAVPDAVIQSLQRDADKFAADRPRAVDHVHTEGTLPHQGIRDQSLEAEKDLPLMRDLALIWHKNHDKAILSRLTMLLDAWASVYQPDFDPIDETVFEPTNLPMATRQKVAVLLHKWSAGYIEKLQGTNVSINNWSSHRVKLATMAAAALGDVGLFDAARAQFQYQLGRNLHPDGQSIDFEKRDALYYQVYDLEPLVRSAMAARTRGEDWLNMKGANGATVAAGLNWLMPYVRGEKTHEEFVHSTVKFDLERKNAGVHGFGGVWDPKGAGELYWMASTLDVRYRPIAQALGNEPPWIAACWPPR